MEGHHGQVPRDMTDEEDFDTMVQLSARLGRRGNFEPCEVGPVTYLSEEHTCGYAGLSEEPCPICSLDSHTPGPVADSVVPAQESTPQSPADSTATEQDAVEHENDAVQDPLQEQQPEDNLGAGLAIVNPRFPGQIWFDTHWNPRRIPSRRRGVSKGGPACPTCRKRKIRVCLCGTMTLMGILVN